MTRNLIAASCIVFVGLAACWSAALASEILEDSGFDESAIEEIVVTGTRIKRQDFTTPSPLTTINSEALDFSGQATLEDALNQMPQVIPSWGRTSNNPGTGTAGVDLRGFGPQRTLVLLDGRRIAPTTTQGVDLNNIPEVLIDRVEVITGGTSAVYGSDAIAGVINFITKKDFSGFGVEAGMTMTEQGDGETYDVSITYGHDFENGRGNITLFANYFERQPLFAGDRKFTSVAWIDTWEGELIQGGSSRVPEGVIYYPYADLGTGPDWATFNPDGTPRPFIDPDDLYNYAPVNYLQVPLKRYTVGMMGHYALTDRIEGYFDVTVSRREPSLNLAPVPAQLAAEINIDNPILTPETRQLFEDNYVCGPNLACMILGKRLLELGPRRFDGEPDRTRIVAGARGDIWGDWSIDGWATYTSDSGTGYLRNDASRSRVLQGLLVDPATGECHDPSGGCVPVNLFGEGSLSQEAAAFIRMPVFERKDEATHYEASVFVTGSPTDTWAGALDVAVGAEWRRHDSDFHSDEALASGDSLGYAYMSPIAGVDEVFEIYGEAVIPIASDMDWARHLGLEVGGRYSEYKHAGGVWTYKAGADWQVNDSLRFRTMHQRSVRAPNSSELFKEQGIAVGAIYTDDPCSASSDPVANGNVEKCLMQGLPADQIGVFEQSERYPVEYLLGGNPDLEPEVGKTLTVGAVITPASLPDLSLSVDYFEFEVTDTIGSIDAMEICFDPGNTQALFCENISRDATGNIANIVELTSNRGILETSGVDTQIQFLSGDFGADVYWTHMLINKEQENPATEIIDCAGYFGWPCTAIASTLPKNRVTTNAFYTKGPVELHLTWRWIESTKNAAPLRSEIYGYPDPDLGVPRVSSKNYVDFGFGYEFTGNIVARFGISNVTDTDPPQMADAVWNNNTDTGLYDVFGRSYYLTLSARYE